MSEIYLISNTQSSDPSINNLAVCAIHFNKFTLDTSKFHSLIVTSKNAINALIYNNIKIDPSLKTYAIGEGSLKACKEAGLKRVYLAKNSHGREFAYEIEPLLGDEKILYISAKVTLSGLLDILKEKNITHIVGYENRCLNLEPSKKPPKNSILIFTSPRNLECFVENFGWDESYRVVSIGETTSRYLKKYCKDISQSTTQTLDECIKLANSLNLTK